MTFVESSTKAGWLSLSLYESRLTFVESFTKAGWHALGVLRKQDDFYSATLPYTAPRQDILDCIFPWNLKLLLGKYNPTYPFCLQFTWSIFTLKKQALCLGWNQLITIMLQSRSRTRPCNVAQNGGSTSICTSAGTERESCNTNPCREFQPIFHPDWIFFAIFPFPETGDCSAISGPAAGSACVFPFNFMGVSHSGCTTIDGDTTPWCSTQTDANDNHVPGAWGYCDAACPVQGWEMIQLYWWMGNTSF